MIERILTPRLAGRLHGWQRWRTYRDNQGDGGGGQFQQLLECDRTRDVPVNGGIKGLTSSQVPDVD